MPTRRELANAIRALSMDAIQKANSGHPGMPLGMADIAEVLWNDFLKHNPSNPTWINRDRFVLSNGHGSMLLYSLLHLTGYDLSIDDLKQFRQFSSKTPGHPEVGDTPGVETTTGPLAQGLGNAVGMALAEKILSAQFNCEGFNLVDHYTYVFLGDGCLMEGLSHEVCSLAGTWGLGKLIVFWDDNGISIDGKVSGWFTDDTAARFRAYHWHVVPQVDGHDHDAIKKAILEARADTKRPSLICCKTTIGFGSPTKAGTAKCHGSPLGADEILKTKAQLNWSYGPFEVPEEIYGAWNAIEKGEAAENAWDQARKKYEAAYPDLAGEFLRRATGELPRDWASFKNGILNKFLQDKEPRATRKMSQLVLQELGPYLPELLGGSADLSESNLTEWAGCRRLTRERMDANYIEYGIREFGMSAIMNGVSLHGGFIPYGGTFLVFHSYAVNAVRMAALMRKRVIYVYTHDSIGVGEDGPTHQPIEQLAALRSTPNLSVWRPYDAAETAVAWTAALERRKGPTALVLSRQNLPGHAHAEKELSMIERGGYVLQDCAGTPQCILIATGSEVALALAAANQLGEKNILVRVVSMLSIDTFLKQDPQYQEYVLPSPIKARVAIEAGVKQPWYQFVGCDGIILGLDQYGMSAPAEKIFEAVGLTVEKVILAVKQLVHP
jgi:transketolase